MIKDKSAQVQVLEVIIVAGMIFASLYFIQGLSAPVYPESHQRRLLKTRAETALSTLDNVPDEYGYHSLLVRYLIEGWKGDHENRTAFNADLWNFTFPSHGYNIYIYNITKMFRNSSTSENDYRTLYLNYYPSEVGRKTMASRMFVNDGYVYEVVVELWYL